MSFSKVINSSRFHRVGRDCHFTVQSQSNRLPSHLHASGQGSPLAPQFPHLNYGDNNSSHLTGLLSGFTETTHVKGIKVSSPESMMEKRYTFFSCPTLPLTSLLEPSNLSQQVGLAQCGVMSLDKVRRAGSRDCPRGGS